MDNIMINEELKLRFKKIKLLLLDVDGVLTDGRIIYDSRGRDSKFFDVSDGLGVFVLHKSGIKTILITAKSSKAIKPRARDMHVAEVFADIFPKTIVLDKILKKYKVSLDEVCFMGDDLVDLALMQKVGLPIAVANASSSIKDVATYITKHEGGRGAVREVAELILKEQGKWKDILNFYGVAKIIILVFAFLFFTNSILLAEGAKDTKDSAQQIGDFSLSGFGDKGAKSWDIAGKSADIYNDVVKLKEVKGNHYAEKDNINLTADNGDFNKTSGVVHLQDNVVITTSDGAKLTTDSLDWDRKQQIVSTLDKVNLERADMNLSGVGAKGQTALKQVVLEKDIRLDIAPLNKQENKKEKITITCDGPLDVDYEKNVAIFNNNVKVEKSDLTIYSDKMQVYFSPKQQEGKAAQGDMVMSSSINKIVAQGNVRILRGENTSYSQEAIYNALDKKITLTGKPQITIYQTENLNATFGN